ncbi:MAG: hypothetical protein LBM28_00825 [Oscillospiraceae bacterium]|jgi:hypothetical protein|nr:hypothetical protein [Oscillospiraceae bacterium]
MKHDSAKNAGPSEAQIRQILSSSEGKQLIELLSKGGAGALQQAAEAYKKGDASTAEQILTPLVQSPEAAALLKKINKK